MGEVLLKVLIHFKIIEFVIGMKNDDGRGLGPVHHIGQLFFPQIRINRQGNEPGPLAGDPGKEAVHTVGGLDDDPGMLFNPHLHKGDGHGIHQFHRLFPGESVF